MYLLQYFGAVTRKSDRLRKSVLYAHYPELIFQAAWSVLQSTLKFAPQFALYNLLKLLEQRSQGAAVDNAAWGLVVGLGVAIILAAWTQAWEHWICWARLGQPLRAELSAMIFSKALRRKDVKGVGKAKVTERLGSNNATISTNDPGSESQTDPLLADEAETGLIENAEGRKLEDEDEDLQKTRQSTINLVVSIPCFLNIRKSLLTRFAGS